MSETRPDPKLLEVFCELATRFRKQCDDAVLAGKITEDEILAVFLSSMMRAIDRTAALPDDRDLTTDEKDALKANMQQVAVAAICVVDELPSEGLGVIVAAFEVGVEGH